MCDRFPTTLRPALCALRLHRARRHHGGQRTLRAAIRAERIERSILVLRGHKVLLDADLAKLYGVETKVLLQALKKTIGDRPR